MAEAGVMVDAFKDTVELFKTRVKDLEAKIKELEGELSTAYDGTLLMAGYDQCLEDMQGVVDGAFETTWNLGPTAGLNHLLVELEKRNVTARAPRGVPHDWLSRWKVELA